MFKELVPFLTMKANPHPELRALMSAELPGGGDCVNLKSASFLSCCPSQNVLFLLHILKNQKKIKQTAELSEDTYDLLEMNMAFRYPLIS